MENATPRQVGRVWAGGLIASIGVWLAVILIIAWAAGAVIPILSGLLAVASVLMLVGIIMVAYQFHLDNKAADQRQETDSE